LFIPTILGTGREGSNTQKVAEFVLAELKDRKVNTEMIFVADFATLVTTKDPEDELVQRWQMIASKADGLIIVSPEYNRGYPGELKILLDKAYVEYHRKPMGIVTVSNGRGGTKAAQQLEWTALGLKMVPVPRSVYVQQISEET